MRRRLRQHGAPRSKVAGGFALFRTMARADSKTGKGMSSNRSNVH
jgi:hypothetical protein